MLSRQLLLPRYLVPALWLVVVCLPVFAQPANPAAPGESTNVAIDPELERSREIRSLISRITEELYANGNPEAARRLCRRVLELDPENAAALLYLNVAERQLRGEATTGSTSRVSSMPRQDYYGEAVMRARPTTPSAVLPSQRSAAVTAEPSASSSWLKSPWMRYTLIGLLVVIAVLLGIIVYDRLFADKRRRKAQAEFFDMIQAGNPVDPASASAPFPDQVSASGITEATSGTSALDSVETNGTGLELEPGEEQPDADADQEVDYWDKDDRGGAPPDAYGSIPTAGADDDSDSMIAAPDLFGDEADDEKVDSEEPPREAPDSIVPDEEPTDFDELDVTDTEEPEPVAKNPFDNVTEEVEEEEPLVLDGFDLVSDPVEGTGEEDLVEESGPRRALRPEAVLSNNSGADASDAEPATVELTPFSLEDSTDDEAQPSKRGLSATSELQPLDEPVEQTARFDKTEENDLDFPIGRDRTTNDRANVADTVVEPKAASHDRDAHTPQQPSPGNPADDLTLDDFDGDFDEIVITPGRRGEAPRAGGDDQPPVGPHESTMIDGRARHKAVFHDQLARGLDALQNARYAEAVKYLSVAHAMDPADTHAREKLREAREKQSRSQDSD